MRASCFWVWIFFGARALQQVVCAPTTSALGARARAFISFALAIVEKQR